MKSILFAILALGLCLARSVQGANLYLPHGYSVPAGVESYTASQVDDVLARLIGEEPKDAASYRVLPVATEFNSVIAAGPRASSAVVLLLPSGSEYSAALKEFSASAPIAGNYFTGDRKRMTATVFSQKRGILDQFENIIEIATRRKNIAESIKTLQNNCHIAKDVSVTLDGKIAYNGIPLFSADSEEVEKVFAELAEICLFVSDAVSRPSADITVIDALFDMFDFALTEEQKKALENQMSKLIEMLIEAARKGSITLVGIEIDDIIGSLKPRALEVDSASSVVGSESGVDSSSSSEYKEKKKSHVLPAAEDLPQKQIFIWTGVLLVVTMAVVFVMMLGVGVDCERDTLLSRMVSL